MQPPCPVVLKPDHQPLLAKIIYLLVRPYLNGEPTALQSGPHLELLAELAVLAWNTSRVEGEPEGAGLAERMQADFGQKSPLLADMIGDLLRRARAITIPDAPGAAHVSIVFERGTLIITAVPRAPASARDTEVH